MALRHLCRTVGPGTNPESSSFSMSSPLGFCPIRAGMQGGAGEMLWWSPSTLRFAAAFARVIPTSRRKGIFSIILNNPGLPQASVPQQVVPRLSVATCRAISSSPALLSALLPAPRLVPRGASAGGGFPGEVAQELGHGGWTAVGKQRGSDRASGVSNRVV